MGTSMISLGAIVVAGASARTARSLDSLVRQTRALDGVVLVVGPEPDRRVAEWLDATAAARQWVVVREPLDTPGATLNAALAALATDWCLVLEAGDTLPVRAAQAVAERLAAGVDPADILVGAARVVGVGVDETAHVEAPAEVEALDPAHAALRAVCWRRAAVEAAGGFDAELRTAVRYELWLRLLGRGSRTEVIPERIVQLRVDEGEPLVAEITAPHYRTDVGMVVARHAHLLESRVSQVLAARAARVASLGPRHLRALERHESLDALDDQRAGVDDEPARMPPGLGQRASPLSRKWGYERGGPLDRVYIERFIGAHAADIAGRVLEVQEADYTRRFGGTAVVHSDVVDVDDSNAGATVIADLRAAANIPDAAYDCVILTQTLHVIAPMAEAVAECHRILKPGGVLLATLPCVSRVCLEYGRDGDFWRVTPAGARHLFEPVFGDGVTVSVFGNAMAGAAFLYGLGPAEVDQAALETTDIYNPTLVGVRAIKSGPATGAPAIRPMRQGAGVALLYHRVGGAEPDPHGLNVTLDAFERQAAWLSTHCAVLPLADLVQGARDRTLPPRAVALTFDDGYSDMLTGAAPVLGRYGLAATCFVATEGLNGPHAFWWDRLAALLLGPGARPATLSIALPGAHHHLPTATDGERLFAHGLVYHAVVGVPAAARELVLDQLAAWAPDARVPDTAWRMSADQVRDLAACGLAIGAHTVSHPQLPTLDAAAQAREIAESRRILEGIVGAAVTALAYPFGAFDDTTIEAASRAGITHAFTCEPRALRAGDEPLRLPRVDPREPRLGRFIAAIEHTLADSAQVRG